MTGKYILQKDHLKGFLRKLAKEHRLVAPVRNIHGDLMFQEVDSVDTVNLDLSEQAQESPKSFLFPQEETLFSYKIRSDGGYEFSPTVQGEPTIFFGLRSCDISAILYMDVIFLRSPRDLYYTTRRSGSILIGIGCTEPGENCFCNAIGTGPFLEFGFDLQLTDLGDRFFVESGRAKGERLIQKWPQFFRPATKDDANEQYQLALEAKAGFKRQVYVETAFNKIRENDIDEGIWRELALRCQGCGGCAYICPTCTCFTIYDRGTSPETGERVRSWDACTHGGFTRMAGGHNPVNLRIDTLKRRFLHKLYYDYLKYKRPSCVGCGRCVGMCFGGVDIVRFVDMVCEGAKESAAATPHMLGSLLLEAGLLGPHDLEQALAQQAETGKPLGTILIEMGLVNQEEVAGALALQRRWTKQEKTVER